MVFGFEKKDGWFEIEKNKPLLDALEKEGVPRYPEILAPDGKVDAKKIYGSFQDRGNRRCGPYICC